MHTRAADETRAVKAALTAAGIQFRRVFHGTGTACTWLKIAGIDWDQRDRVIRIAQEVTGRTGEYDGRINAS